MKPRIKIDIGLWFARVFMINALPLIIGVVNVCVERDKIYYLFGMNAFFSAYLTTLACILFIVGFFYSMFRLID